MFYPICTIVDSCLLLSRLFYLILRLKIIPFLCVGQIKALADTSLDDHELRLDLGTPDHSLMNNPFKFNFCVNVKLNFNKS